MNGILWIMDFNSDRKYMLGDKSKFGSSQNMPKKGQQNNCVHSTRANYRFCNVKIVSHFTIPLKVCTFFMGIWEWNIHFLPFVHLPIWKSIKWLVTQKRHFFVGFPHIISTRIVCYIKCTFKRTSLWLRRFKISRVPFLIEDLQNVSKICKKGTNCENLNLNKRRLLRLKVHVR